MALAVAELTPTRARPHPRRARPRLRAGQPHQQRRPRPRRATDRRRAPRLPGRSARRRRRRLQPNCSKRLRRELRDDLIGLGAIAERMLSDPDAQEWMVNAPTRVFRDTGERLERVPDLTFTDDRQVRAFLDRLLEQVEGKRLDRITPRIEARLPDGSRLTAAIPPVSSNGHVICSIRRFKLKANSLADLVDARLPLPAGSRLPRRRVRVGKNIVVAGRVSSGKTTLLNALGRAVAASERFVCCESSAELQLPAVLANCVGYEARPGNTDGLPAITLEDLVSDALRMNPDRIVVGECRGPETMAMLWAFATGHAGMTSRPRRIRRTRPPKPRPLRAHLRRPHRHPPSTRLAPRDRPRRPLRPPRHLQQRRTPLPPPPRRPDRRTHRHRRHQPTLNPLFEGAGPNLHYLAQRPPPPPRTPSRRIPTMTAPSISSSSPSLLIASGCGGANSHAAARLTTAYEASSNEVACLGAQDGHPCGDPRRTSSCRTYVLWHNRIPIMGDALDARPCARCASKRCRHPAPARNPDQEPLGGYTVVSITLAPSYATATAVIRSHQRVAPYESGHRLGRSDLGLRPRPSSTPSARQHRPIRRLERHARPMTRTSRSFLRRLLPRVRVVAAGAARIRVELVLAAVRPRQARASAPTSRLDQQRSGGPSTSGRSTASAAITSDEAPAAPRLGGDATERRHRLGYPALPASSPLLSSRSRSGRARSGTRTAPARPASTSPTPHHLLHGHSGWRSGARGRGSEPPRRSPRRSPSSSRSPQARSRRSPEDGRADGSTRPGSGFHPHHKPRRSRSSVGGEDVTVTAVPQIEWEFGDGTDITPGPACHTARARSLPTRSRTSTRRAASPVTRARPLRAPELRQRRLPASAPS